MQNAQYLLYQANIQQKVVGFPLDDLHKRIASLHRIFHTAQSPSEGLHNIRVLLWFCMPSGSQHTCSAVDTERIAEYGGETIPARFMIKLIKNWYIKTITLIIVITSLHKGFVPPASLHTILAAPCIVRYPKHL